MIKILKFFRPTAICEICSAVLEYEQSDVQDRQMHTNECKEYIECPICGYNVYIDKE